MAAGPSVAAFDEPVHVPARVQRRRGGHHGVPRRVLALAGVGVPERALVVAVARRPARRQPQAGVGGAHALQRRERLGVGDRVQRGRVIAVVGGRKVGHGRLRRGEVRSGVPRSRGRRARGPGGRRRRGRGGRRGRGRRGARGGGGRGLRGGLGRRGGVLRPLAGRARLVR